MIKQSTLPKGLMKTIKNSGEHRLLITGLLAGVAVGAAIALILTSDKNNEYKQKASDWFCDLLSSSKDNLASVGDILSQKIAKTKA